MESAPVMLTTHAVGIDLGTTYSCIAYLNKQGEPVTLPNQEGELSTPSVVLFEDGEAIVGTEALRNAIVHPDRVVQNAKRFMGERKKKWVIDGKPYTPIDISTFILKKLLAAAQEQIGPIEQAVITVPAQFSDAQRHATIEAGHRAGLQRVDIINEPVAAALCYVLGTEGLWFTELAETQRIMVYDLGGGTFDLSLVKYEKDEVSVIASSGDLNLGGIDWNQALIEAIARRFGREFGEDPRTDRESLQYLALESEQCKRSLTVRPRAALACQHAGHRKTYQIEQPQFEKLTRHLVDHTQDITRRMLRENKLGWAHVDVVLTTGGASRMPMIRNMLKKLSGRTLNTALSPDLSIAHGATYYAGMLLTNNKFARSILSEKASERLSQVKQRSVNARGLGIMVRHHKTNERIPYYMVKANTPLPADATENFGTVVPDQKRVNLQIIESGTSPEQPPVVIGNCVIDDLPPRLPEGSEIAVTISYDSMARVHVSAKDVTSGRRASTEIIRQDNLVPQLESDQSRAAEVSTIEKKGPAKTTHHSPLTTHQPAPPAAPRPQPSASSQPPKPKVVSGSQTTAPRPVAVSPPTPVVAGQPPTRRPSEAVKSAVEGQPAKPAQSAEKIGGLVSDGLEDADQPVPLCNKCGAPLDTRGRCPSCARAPGGKAAAGGASKASSGGGRKYYVRAGGKVQGPFTLRQLQALSKRGRLRSSHQVSLDGVNWQPAASLKSVLASAGGSPADAKLRRTSGRAADRPAARKVAIPLPSDDQIVELSDAAGSANRPPGKPRAAGGKRPGRASPRTPGRSVDDGEAEFWQLVDD